ncbi:MAG: peptidyl-prolyl cis-trans isomerase [Candidatus Eisenbacteria bacterium]|nr:peptidyl-prolyl cis-trans isomerase [Candidatus Eisenbacteria bacterium]
MSSSPSTHTPPAREFGPRHAGFRRGFALGLLAGVMTIAGGLFALSWPLFSSCSGDGSTGGAKGGISAGGGGSSSGAPVDGAAGLDLDPKLAKIVLAKVGRDAITVRDLDWKMRVQFPAMLDLKGISAIKQKKEVLRAMVEQYCWVTIAEKKGYDEDAEFKDVLELSRRFILANHAAKREVYSRINVTDPEIQRYYEDNQDQYQVVARCMAYMVVLGSRAEAERIRQRILAGESIETLAQAHSIEKNTQLALGRIGTVTHRSTINGFEDYPALNQAIMEIPAGGVSAPIETPKGFCVVRVTERSDRTVQPLEAVREDIKKKIELKATNELFSQTLSQVKEELGAEIDEKGWDDYCHTFLTDLEIFQLAQQEQKPEDRIRHYEGLRERYPDSAKAPQALFMVGFTWAEELRDFAKARAVFQQFLKEYPASELTQSAQWMLDNMEKGIENNPEAQAIKQRAGSR